MIPYLWWVQRRTQTDLSPKHLQVCGTLRSAIVALIALALMQPVLYRSGALVSVVYLLDVSESVSPQAIQSAIQWIQQTNSAGHPDHARFIPFAANSTVFDTTRPAETGAGRRCGPRAGLSIRAEPISKRNRHRHPQFCSASSEAACSAQRRQRKLRPHDGHAFPAEVGKHSRLYRSVCNRDPIATSGSRTSWRRPKSRPKNSSRWRSMSTARRKHSAEVRNQTRRQNPRNEEGATRSAD